MLAFQKGETLNGENQFIRGHLPDCEFCAAEVEFYAHYPQAEEAFVEAEIPVSLYELAEALLGNKQKKYSLLNKLLNETETLTFEKA